MRLIILMLLLPGFSISQTGPLPLNKSNIVEFTDVVKVDSIDATTLYSRAKLFIAQSFVDNKAVTQLNDDAGKQIYAKGNLRVSCKDFLGNHEYGTVAFAVTIQAKDGRYRYSITDFQHNFQMNNHNASGGSIENDKPRCGGLMMTKKCWNEIKDQTNTQMKAFINTLQEYMTGKSNESKSDW